MSRRDHKNRDDRERSPRGTFLRNAPWRQEFVDEKPGRLVSTGDIVVLVFLVFSSLAVGVTLWFHPPTIITFKPGAVAASNSGPSTERALRTTAETDFDASKFEVLADDDPSLPDDLDDVLTEPLPDQPEPTSL